MLGRAPRRQIFARIGSGLAAASLVLGGCVSTGDTIGDPLSGAASWLSGLSGGTSTGAEETTDLTPAERRMREQSRAFQRTVWEGVLIGASAGALWGVVAREDAKDVLTKALIGGAVGGLAGAYIAHKQKQYATKEDQLDSMIADVRQSNRQTEELITSVEQVIAEDKRRLASVEKRYQSGQATEAEVKTVRARVADNRTVVAQASKGAREKYTMFQGAEQEFRQQNPGTDTKGLQTELKAYNKQIETLDGLADTIKVA